MGEAVVVAVVRSGRQEKQMIGLRGQLLGQLVSLGLIDLVTRGSLSASCRRCTCALRQ